MKNLIGGIQVLEQHLELKEWLKARKEKQMFSGHADKVFPSDLKKAWYNALSRAKIIDLRFFDLRHTCCSSLAMAGEGLLTIGRLVGHKNPASIKSYTHLDTSAKKVTGNILNNKYYKKG